MIYYKFWWQICNASRAFYARRARAESAVVFLTRQCRRRRQAAHGALVETQQAVPQILKNSAFVGVRARRPDDFATAGTHGNASSTAERATDLLRQSMEGLSHPLRILRRTNRDSDA
ncbi:MAG: hypothetical protein SXG53_08005 [Pseudomonadota bacterium]|nr:hypothetical protein [Pseudomonadota bacterium]